MREADAIGKLVLDAHIVAVCRERGARVPATADRDFERLSGLRLERLARILTASSLPAGSG